MAFQCRVSVFVAQCKAVKKVQPGEWHKDKVRNSEHAREICISHFTKRKG